MYTDEFKKKVIEEFIKYPYYGTISKKMGISDQSVRTWVREANIDIHKLKNEIPQMPYIPESSKTVNLDNVTSYEMYNSIIIKEQEEILPSLDDVEEIEFSLNGYAFKMKRQYIKIFLEVLKNDWPYWC